MLYIKQILLITCKKFLLCCILFIDFLSLSFFLWQKPQTLIYYCKDGLPSNELYRSFLMIEKEIFVDATEIGSAVLLEQN